MPCDCFLTIFSSNATKKIEELSKLNQIHFFEQLEVQRQNNEKLGEDFRP
ncbi:MAG: hypothetical protein ACI81T_003394 [Bacteroidia bacterium]|jgi:hypothetical protein